MIKQIRGCVELVVNWYCKEAAELKQWLADRKTQKYITTLDLEIADVMLEDIKPGINRRTQRLACVAILKACGHDREFLAKLLAQ